MAKFHTYFYKTISGKEVVIEFIDALDVDTRTKTRNGIRFLEEYGLSLIKTQWLKKVNNKPAIFELRIISKVSVRLLFVFIKPSNFLITNIFIKKTNKLPKEELAIAIKRAREFI